MWAPPPGRSPGPQVAPTGTNVQCHYGGSCCSRRGEGGAFHPQHRAEGDRRAAWRRCRVPPSRTSLLPCGTASTEPGRPLAFHYWAYESSSPGKYVAIKINRPALSAEHNANYLWAVCAVFIIVQLRALRLPASPPARPARGEAAGRLRRGGRGLWAPEWGSEGEAARRAAFRAQSLTPVCHSFHVCWPRVK